MLKTWQIKTLNFDLQYIWSVSDCILENNVYDAYKWVI
jgi:hypothetical protein